MALLENLSKNKSLKASAYRIANGNCLHQDLFQHSLLKIYDLGEDRAVGIFKEGNIEGYMAVVMHREWHNQYSEFNKQYKPKLPEHQEIYQSEAQDTTQADIDLCLCYFDKVTPDRIQVAKEMERSKREANAKDKFHYDTALMELYIELGGVTKISRATGINKKSIYNDLNRIKGRINGEDTTNK